MNNIEDIWAKGNEQDSKNDKFNEAFVRKSISETSIGITSKLSKVVWFGIIASILSILGFIYNSSFYLGNTPILILIIVLFVASLVLLAFLLTQSRVITKMDAKELDLRNMLIYKIKYFNARLPLIQHSIALSIVFVTFAINLTMESSDGVFELRKILILCVFYLFSYFVVIFLFKLSYRVYLTQLNDALMNLEENTFKSFDEELKKHKRIMKVIGLIILGVFLIGIVFLLVKTLI